MIFIILTDNQVDNPSLHEALSGRMMCAGKKFHKRNEKNFNFLFVKEKYMQMCEQ